MSPLICNSFAFFVWLAASWGLDFVQRGKFSRPSLVVMLSAPMARGVRGVMLLLILSALAYIIEILSMAHDVLKISLVMA